MSNSIIDPQDPDYCEQCGGECVTGTCRVPPNAEERAALGLALTEADLTFLHQVCEDAAQLLECNCSYDSGTEPEDRCDGTCTHSMARRGMKMIDALSARIRR